MTSPSKVDVRNLQSVRHYAQGGYDIAAAGWDLVAQMPDADIAGPRRGIWALRKSPIARRIVTFNLIAMMVLMVGIFLSTAARESLTEQRARALINEAQLIADVFEAQLRVTTRGPSGATPAFDAQQVLADLTLRGDVAVSLFSINGDLLGRVPLGPVGMAMPPAPDVVNRGVIGDMFGAIGAVWRAPPDQPPEQVLYAALRDSVMRAAASGTQLDVVDNDGSISLVATTPIIVQGNGVAVIAVATAAGEVAALVRRERAELLWLFAFAIAVSIGLSLVLASKIAHPLADLATAAEASHQKNARKMSPLQVRIPDLTARPDEIGRLSGALRAMVSALYERIESNEQFAADVAHEVKNPLASLRSAVGTMRVAIRDDQRERLLQVIEHDVKRLDRLVSDIANASRLDSDLVKEEEESFDLIPMLRNIIDFLSVEARVRGIDIVTDLPAGPIMLQGLEGRLAQVFVNLIGNALSFCDAGDAIRIWIRNRENRVLVVVEDTGPGIPDDALQKIFQRFYSERPAGQFGNHSGLGLAISKQIVVAHGGVIWAENIRPADVPPDTPPSGARFVVGLPI